MRVPGVRHWLPLITLMSCLWPLAAGATPAADSLDPPADARAWLLRIHTAANQRNYQGTMVFTAGGMLSSSRVAHFSVGGQSFERLEALDGRLQRVYRHNDAVHTLWSQSRLAVIETRNVANRIGSLTKVAEPRAAEQYELKTEGSERVAGREAMVLLLRPRDALRYPQRVWADRATGLMLRADVIGPSSGVLESTAFSQIDIGVRPQPETVLAPMNRLDGYRVLRPQALVTQMEAEGWTMARSVPGFILAGCLKRPLDATAPAGGQRVAVQVLQAVFSDGLTHVSLFIEPFDGMRHKVGLQAQIGATATMTLRRGDHWITAMGEVPVATLKLFNDALDRRP
jgi:sigma-E factor negative regulatory protein RseB